MLGVFVVRAGGGIGELVSDGSGLLRKVSNASIGFVLRGQSHSADRAFPDAAKVKLAFVFDDVGDLSEGLR